MRVICSFYMGFEERPPFLWRRAAVMLAPTGGFGPLSADDQVDYDGQDADNTSDVGNKAGVHHGDAGGD